MSSTQKITPFLWFDKEAGQAVEFYLSIFKNSKIISRNDVSDTPSGDVQIYKIELMGQPFSLMNAGPLFKFNEAISFVIECENQEEVDYYWNSLTAQGGKPGQCGWLKDPFGVSWQVVPQGLGELIVNDKTDQVFQAMLKMSKIIIADLEKIKA